MICDQGERVLSVLITNHQSAVGSVFAPSLFEEGKALEPGKTIYAFRSEGVIKIIRKLDAASGMARALENCLPALVGVGNRQEAEAEILRALAAWEEACRSEAFPALVPRGDT